MFECGFFNAVDGDRTYNADSFNEFFNGILSDTGIYKKSGGALEIVPATGMKVKVKTGRGRIKEHWFNMNADKTFTIDASDVALDRYDGIIFTLDLKNRDIDIGVLTGIPDENPVKPPLTRNLEYYEICLAYIHVRAGATTITSDDIIDTRDDTDLCGFVKLQIDTVNAGIKEYRRVITTSSEVTELTIGIPQFDVENDLFFSNIGGVMFVKDQDYTISGTGSNAKMVLKNSIRAGNMVEFRVIKAVLEVL